MGVLGTLGSMETWTTMRIVSNMKAIETFRNLMTIRT